MSHDFQSSSPICTLRFPIGISFKNPNVCPQIAHPWLTLSNMVDLGRPSLWITSPKCFTWCDPFIDSLCTTNLSQSLHRFPMCTLTHLCIRGWVSFLAINEFTSEFNVYAESPHFEQSKFLWPSVGEAHPLHVFTCIRELDHCMLSWLVCPLC